MFAGSVSQAAPLWPAPGARRDALWIALGLALVAASYFYMQATFPLVPGNRASAPLGWWAWDDQKQYLIGAKALLNGDLDPNKHLYPPLYPLIGALFLKLSPDAPFFWPDLALTLGFFGVFVALFRRYLGTAAAVACAMLGMLAYPDLRAQWLMPWTTTLAALCILAALALLDRALRHRHDDTLRARALNAGGFGLALGLLAADRPVDVAVTAPLWLAYAALVLIDLRRNWICVATGGAGVAAAVAPYLMFNVASFGTLLGRYVAHNAQMGFDPSVLPMALYSQLIDSGALFAEAHADWASRVPLLLLAVLFLPPSLAWGPLAFRLAAACGLIEFAIYYCDHDIIPTGTFRFCNIHYFKWLTPVALALAFHAARAAASQIPALRKRGALTLAAVAASALVASVVVAAPLSTPARVEQGEHELTITLSGEATDYVDIAGVEGVWGAIYFPTGGGVSLDDGAPLARISQWRLLPTAQGARLWLPGRPAARRLTLQLPEGVRALPGAAAVAGRLHWTLRGL